MTFTLNSGTVAQLQNLLTADNYSGAYQLVVDSISDLNGNPLTGVDNSVWLWFYGALSTNRDVGPFSDFIRSYTENQYEIRTGNNFTETLLQDASDDIAREVVQSIINNNGDLPTLNQIGVDDASIVAAQILNDDGLWSGNLLFVGLGDRSFFDSAVLGDAANTYDLLTVVESMASAFNANTLSEWQNALEDLAEDSLVDATGISISTALSTAISVVTGNSSLVASVISDANDFIEDAYAGRLGVFSTLLVNRVLGTINADNNLQGTSVVDIYHGGQNSDTLIGSLGLDLLDGGAGQDLLDYSALGQPLLVTFDNKNSVVPFAAEIRSTGTLGSDDWAFDIEALVLGDQSDQVTALAGSSSTIIKIDTAGGSDIVNLSQYSGEIYIEAGTGDDQVTVGSGGAIVEGGGGNDDLDGGAGNDSLFGGEGIDSVTGGAGDDLLGNIHAPTFDYISMTPAERQAIIDSEDNGVATTLSGGAGDDIYLIDYSSAFDPQSTHGAGDFSIDDTDPGTMIFVRDIVTGAIDPLGGTIIPITDTIPAVVSEVDIGDGETVQCTQSSSVNTTFGFIGEESGAFYVFGNIEGGFTISGPEEYCGTSPGGGGGADPGASQLRIVRYDSPTDFYQSGAGGGSGSAAERIVIRSSTLTFNDLVKGARPDLGLDTISGGGGPAPSTSSGVTTMAVAGGYSATGTAGDDFVFSITGTQDVDLLGGDDTTFTGDSNDTIDGGAGNDSLVGGGGDDDITGGSGADTIDGGAGLDIITGGTSADALIGAAGNDSLLGEGGADTLEGDVGADTLDGGAAADILLGGDGDDLLIGGQGADSLFGGLGNDTVSYSTAGAGVTVSLTTGAGINGEAQGDVLVDIESVDGSSFADAVTGDANSNVLRGLNGADTLSGGLGDDTIIGGADNDDIDGGDGNDSLAGSGGADSLEGGDGNDSITGGDGRDTLRGGAGDDTLLAGDAEDEVFGGAGNDSMVGGFQNDFMTGNEDNDIIIGASGDDTLTGSAGLDTLNGGDGNDSLSGGDGADTLDGGKGDDTLKGGNDADILDGFNGSDSLVGAQGDDTLDGGAQADTLEGGDGNDDLFGDTGNDELSGGSGNDTLSGGGNADTLTGGAGSDRFVFETGAGTDTFADFDAGAGVTDVIDLSGLGPSFDTFTEVQNAATQVGADTVIDFGGGDTITLSNVILSNLHTDDFAFV